MGDRPSRHVLVPALGLLAALGGHPAAAQAIFGTAGDGNLAVLFPTPEVNLPTPEQRAVPGLPTDARPHGVSVIGSDRAVIADFSRSRLHVVRVSSGTLERTVSTAGVWDGTGTIAVSPRLDVMIGAGSFHDGQAWRATFALVRAPFDAPTITPLAIEGHVAPYQTQGIVFDRSGRAYVLTRSSDFNPRVPPTTLQGWINVLDPPYASVAFRIPVENVGGGAIAVVPDGSALLTTASSRDGRVYVFRPPYSAASLPEIVTVPNAYALDGIQVTPDGRRALVVSAAEPRLFSIAAPFGAASAVEEIPLPARFTLDQPGFEDVAISNDGQLALVTGNSTRDATTGAGGRLPALFVKAPFTRAGAQPFAVDILGEGRGAGSARFVACPPPVPPASPEIVPTGAPAAPVTATDFLTARWSPQSYGSRFEWRINSDSFASTAGTSVERIPPRGTRDPITLFVRSYACVPEQGPSEEARSATYALAPPGASFTASATTVRAGEAVSFTDTSSPQATAWAWFFGNAGFSPEQNPRFAFPSPGTYFVRLMATNGSGSSLSGLTLVTVTASNSVARRRLPPGGPDAEPEAGPPPGTEASFAGLRFGGGARPLLRLRADEEALVFLRLESAGRLLVERRIALSPGEEPHLDLPAYLPEGFRDVLDVRVVSDRPVRVRLEEERK